MIEESVGKDEILFVSLKRYLEEYPNLRVKVHLGDGNYLVGENFIVKGRENLVDREIRGPGTYELVQKLMLISDPRAILMVPPGSEIKIPKEIEEILESLKEKKLEEILKYLIKIRRNLNYSIVPMNIVRKFETFEEICKGNKELYIRLLLNEFPELKGKEKELFEIYDKLEKALRGEKLLIHKYKEYFIRLAKEDEKKKSFSYYFLNQVFLSVGKKIRDLLRFKYSRLYSQFSPLKIGGVCVDFVGFFQAILCFLGYPVGIIEAPGHVYLVIKDNNKLVPFDPILETYGLEKMKNWEILIVEYYTS